MMDKIEYEEWALKAIDPALAPKPWEAVKAKVAAAGKSGEQKELEQKAEIESDPVRRPFLDKSGEEGRKTAGMQFERRARDERAARARKRRLDVRKHIERRIAG